MGFKTKDISNIPILVTQSVVVDDLNMTVTFGFGDSVYGIYSPFEGVFALKVEQMFSAPSHYVICIDNVYGSAKTLFEGYSQVTVGDIAGVGLYMLSFDTSERKLYKVNSNSSSSDLEWEEL